MEEQIARSGFSAALLLAAFSQLADLLGTIDLSNLERFVGLVHAFSLDLAFLFWTVVLWVPQRLASSFVSSSSQVVAAVAVVFVLPHPTL